MTTTSLETTTCNTSGNSDSSSSTDADVSALQYNDMYHKNKCLDTPVTYANTNTSNKASYFAHRKPSANGRRVQFCDKGHTCQEFDMWEPELVAVIWFTHDEYDEMKANFEFTVFMLDAGCPEKVEDDEHTCRGLEKRSEEGAWCRYERKRDYYNAVLDEQERQWEENEDGEEDLDAIGEIAVEVTRESRLEAQDQGVLDEIAVYGHLLRQRRRELSQQEDDVDTITITTDITSASERSDATSSSRGC